MPGSYPDSWREPAVFGAIADAASLDADEMLKTFNMGVGFALVLSASDAPHAAATLRAAGETVYEIGEIDAGDGGRDLWVTRRRRCASAY